MLSLGEAVLIMSPGATGIFRVVEKKRIPPFFVDLIELGELDKPVSTTETKIITFTPMIPEIVRSRSPRARFDTVLSRLGIKIIDRMETSISYEAPEFFYGSITKITLRRGMGIETWAVSGTEETRETLSFKFETRFEHPYTGRVEVDAEKFGVRTIERLRISDINEAIEEAGKRNLKFVICLYPQSFTFQKILKESISVKTTISSVPSDYQAIASVPSPLGSGAGFRFINVDKMILTNKSTSDATISFSDGADETFDIIVPASSTAVLEFKENGIDFYESVKVKPDQAPVSIVLRGYYW